MIYGCGIDIEETERFNKHYFEKGRLSNLIYDIFTTKEIENFSYFGKEAFLKGFCFKEAFYKALSSAEIGHKDVEIIFTSETKFEIFTSELVQKIFKEQKIVKIDASVNMNDSFAVFKVILIKA